MNYTLIAYKPSSDDYCRGCHMASYSSDQDLFFSQSEDEIIEEWVKIKVRNENLDTNEVGYETTLLINGLHQGHWFEGENLPTWSEFERIQDKAHQAYKDFVRKREQEKQKEAEEKARAAAERKRQKEIEAAAAKEEHDRQEYERLRNKYGDSK